MAETHENQILLESGTNEIEIMEFTIDGNLYGINVAKVREILISAPVNWTPNPGAYFAWEIACGIFVTIPFVCFCVLSGLQSIDSSYYEAATVDGAGYRSEERRVGKEC